MVRSYTLMEVFSLADVQLRLLYSRYSLYSFHEGPRLYWDFGIGGLGAVARGRLRAERQIQVGVWSCARQCALPSCGTVIAEDTLSSRNVVDVLSYIIITIIIFLVNIARTPSIDSILSTAVIELLVKRVWHQAQAIIQRSPGQPVNSLQVMRYDDHLHTLRCPVASSTWYKVIH